MVHFPTTILRGRMLQKTNLRLCFLLILSLFPIQVANAQDLFEAKIRPILATKCFACHTDSALGGLRLDSRDSMMRGGKSGIVIVPGDPDKSLLIAAVRQTGDL